MAIILIDTQAMSVKRTVAFHGVPSNVAWAAPDELLFGGLPKFGGQAGPLDLTLYKVAL